MLAARARAVAFTCTIAVTGSACAQSPASFPARPVRLVVPFPPGGSDTVARMLGQRLAEQFGQPLVVDNRPGAAGTLGAALVAVAPPDGHTLLFATASFPISAGLYRRLPYDPERDFVAAGLVAQGAMLVVTHPSVRAATIGELVQLALAQPDALNYASTGTGGITHLAAAMFARLTATRLMHVPYKGSGPAQTDLLAGQVQIMFDVIGPALPHVRSGRLRALAVTTPARSVLLPELPTVAEAGVPGYAAATWYAVLAPRATPAPVIAQLNDAIGIALAAAGMRERLAGLGFEPLAGSAAAAGAFVRIELERWRRAVRDARIELH